MSRKHEHFELELDLAMAERGYHPDTQTAVWRLIGQKAVSCEAMLDAFTIIDGDADAHAREALANQPALFSD
jgi:hypothetical protein